MNLADLRVFLAVAQQQSLAAAATHLHLTPSAVSKALRRLEDNLGTDVFDRSSRQLVLNASGRRLVERAQLLLAMAQQARADILGAHASVDCRIAGPAVLLAREAGRVARALAGYAEASLRLQPSYEDDALGALARGEALAAIVTGEVMDGRGRIWSPDWDRVALEPFRLQLMAGPSHPLAVGGQPPPLATVLAHPFACPTRSLLCGAQRGERSDGWRDDLWPRTIRYWADDLHLLLGLVRRGEALAYLPQFVAGEPGLVPITVGDAEVEASETAWFVWDRRTAPAWLKDVAAALEAV